MKKKEIEELRNEIKDIKGSVYHCRIKEEFSRKGKIWGFSTLEMPFIHRLWNLEENQKVLIRKVDAILDHLGLELTHHEATETLEKKK